MGSKTILILVYVGRPCSFST